jgi:hypothetical protein
MEQELLKWIQKHYRENNKLPQNKEIKQMALLLSKSSKFKASKGWCDKFIKRNRNKFQNA